MSTLGLEIADQRTGFLIGSAVHRRSLNRAGSAKVVTEPEGYPISRAARGKAPLVAKLVWESAISPLAYRATSRAPRN
jgi:hypothetical protein